MRYTQNHALSFIFVRLSYNIRSFMQKNCPVSCHKKTHKEPEHRRIDDDAQEEFYELTANTAAGKALSMENFEGYITVLVNAARVCGE
mmetsp:Transcript_15929/g.28792  ORF Transcript_15929/g.28792 Transcript_15929/m.28792 type:complete len:88 (-) Transcript_15929:590-853(-)